MAIMLNSLENSIKINLEHSLNVLHNIATNRTTMEQTVIRLQEEARSLREQLTAAERRATEARLPQVESIFEYDGARRYVRLLGMVREGTLQVFDIGAGHVKNYLVARINNMQIVPTGYAEEAYKHNTIGVTPFASRVTTSATGRYPTKPNLQETPRSPRTIRGNW